MAATKRLKALIVRSCSGKSIPAGWTVDAIAVKSAEEIIRKELFAAWKECSGRLAASDVILRKYRD
jgi:hypothetical protein